METRPTLLELAQRAEAALPPERRRPPGASNAEWLRLLAEEGLAKLPPSARQERERAGSNAAWLRLLAERAQAELDGHEAADA